MGLPISVIGGTYTPGAETALNLAAAMVNSSWELANDKTTAFETKIAAITDQATGWLSGVSAPHISSTAVAAPSVSEPTVTVPSSIDTATILADFDTERAAIVADMVTKFTAFQATYFPDDAADYAAAEAWVAGALANPNGGLPVAVQNQITADDHARILGDASRAADAVIQTFAARRFPMPPGAAASAVMQIHQKAQDDMAESSRKITLASVDMMKFAVTTSLSMRDKAMAATLDYIKTLMMGPDIASKVIGIGYDAQSKLISSVSGLIGARTEVQKLIASVGQFNASNSLEAAMKNQAADLTILEDRLKALLTECQAFAQMSTALFNNLHASAGTSYGVSVS